jgi:predicted amidohydrolase
MDIAWENKQDNLRRLREKLEALRGATEIIVLPETFSTGFSMNTDTLAEPVTGNTITTLRQWASEYQIAIAGSYIACEENFVSSESNPLSYKNSTYYNRAFFLTPEGEAYFYDKRHLFRMGNETDNFTAGSHRIIIPYRDWNILLLVCYDLRFPVWSRCRNDYDAIIYVASWPAGRRDVWRTLLRARAIENQAYVLGVNRTGDDPRLHYSGDSAVIGCKGETLAEAGEGETLLTARLDMDELRRFREKFPAWRDADDFDLK